jgi:hypothetical protein
MVSVASNSGSSASSLLEYLLTEHSYRRQVSELPNEQIERLREMLHHALEQRIPPAEIYDAITRGFDQAAGTSVPSPPLASDLIEADGTNQKELMQALLREISAA